MEVGPFNSDTVVFINSSGKASYKGSTANAGILLSLYIDGEIVSQADSFEGESSSMSFFASTSFNVVVKKSKGTSTKIEARLSPRGAGGTSNSDSEVRLNVIGLASGRGRSG